MNRHKYRHMDRHMNRHMHRHKYRQMDRHMNRHMHRHINVSHRHINIEITCDDQWTADHFDSSTPPSFLTHNLIPHLMNSHMGCLTRSLSGGTTVARASTAAFASDS